MSEEQLQTDVIIVGAGPAGLCAAIHLKQLNPKTSVTVIEKGARVGAHILSGAIMEPSALSSLLPKWKDHNPPSYTTVTEDYFYWLTATRSVALPKLAVMKNKGNMIISLSHWCRWLATQAESLGVDIYTGIAAKALIIEDGTVMGICTGEMGVNKQGSHTDRYVPSMAIRAPVTLLAEGCRGSLSQSLIAQFSLEGTCTQTYGLGLKEVWEVDRSALKPGLAIHTAGWPLPSNVYGGGFIYHSDSHISIGIIAGLDYQDASYDPFISLQRLKTHPTISPMFTSARRISYGARTLNEGGYQSIPTLSVPGCALIGCAAGFVDVGKIKGIHNAIKSGMIAAKAIHSDTLKDLTLQIKQSDIGKELYATRNIRPSFQYGQATGLILSGIDQTLLRGRAPWTLPHSHPDHKHLINMQKTNTFKPDNTLTFDKLSSVYLSNTQHEEDQPCHLVLKSKSTWQTINKDRYGAPETFYCPANVYELSQNTLTINAANCLHCKACDIKDPAQNITWNPPQGGEGPNYEDM